MAPAADAPTVFVVCTLRPKQGLENVAVPSRGLFGGWGTGRYAACDTGIKVKLHLTKAKCYWEQGVRAVLLGSNVAVSRHLGDLLSPADVDRKSYKISDVNDDIEGVSNDADDGRIAPEYDSLIPREHEYMGKPNKMIPTGDGGYYPYPLWINGESNPVFRVENPARLLREGAREDC